MLPYLKREGCDCRFRIQIHLNYILFFCCFVLLFVCFQFVLLTRGCSGLDPAGSTCTDSASAAASCLQVFVLLLSRPHMPRVFLG